jgi:hypothetical protein
LYKSVQVADLDGKDVCCNNNLINIRMMKSQRAIHQ